MYVCNYIAAKQETDDSFHEAENETRNNLDPARRGFVRFATRPDKFSNVTREFYYTYIIRNEYNFWKFSSRRRLVEKLPF